MGTQLSLMVPCKPLPMNIQSYSLQLLRCSTCHVTWLAHRRVQGKTLTSYQGLIRHPGMSIGAQDCGHAGSG